MTRDERKWKQDPPGEGYDSSLAIYAEIVSAKGFEESAVFLNYQVITPSTGLRLRRGNLSDGVADTAAAATVFDNFADSEGMLRGTTQRAEGIVPLNHPPCLDVISRRIVSGVFFIYCCFVVIMDVEYPFWIVPALVFLFMLGSGFSIGSIASYKLDKSGRLICGSHPLIETEFYFNHLLSISYDRRKPNAEEIGLLSTKVPTVFLQVYSVGFLGRTTLEGYGYFHINEETSISKDFEVSLWRPKGSAEASMVEHFIGGSIRLLDNRFTHAINEYSRTINRFGVCSVPSGKVRVRYHCIVADPSLAKTALPVSSEPGKTTIKRRSVAEILSRFRLSTDTFKPTQSADSLGTDTWRGLMSRGSSMKDSIPKADRVAEILARARAKIRSRTGSMQDISEESVETSNPLHMATLLREAPHRNRYGDSHEQEKESTPAEDEEAPLLKKNN